MTIFYYSTFDKITTTPLYRNRLELLEKSKTIFFAVNVALCNHLKTRHITQDDQIKRRKSDSDSFLRWINAEEHPWCFPHPSPATFSLVSGESTKARKKLHFPGFVVLKQKKKMEFSTFPRTFPVRHNYQKRRYYQKGMLENPAYGLK